MEKVQLTEGFAHFAKRASIAAGKWQAFLLAVSLVLIWFAVGFWVGFGNQLYQLTINTGTTIVTFLMVFILQNSLNRDTLALQIKLDALIEASSAQNHLMLLDGLPEEELQRLKARLEDKA